MIYSFFDRIKSYSVAFRNRLWVYIYKERFKKFATNSVIKSPLGINGYENIEIGNNVFIGYKSWIAAVPLTGEPECLLKFGNGCIIGNFNHIYATKKIVFGDKVLTADKVYISDNVHEYTNIEKAVLDQRIKQVSEVYIGEGSWIGENVCIIGANIGKHCVIGANSVVTKNIPDYSVVVGNPSKIIKRYCSKTHSWEKTSPEGNFLT